MRHPPASLSSSPRPFVLGLAFVAIAVATACDPERPIRSFGATTGVGVVNAFSSPVDVLIDGAVRVSGVPVGGYSGVDVATGVHTVSVRATAGGGTVGVSMTVVAGRLVSLAATRAAGGALSAASLEDTNAVVPAGATKLRVLHLAALTGEIQVWRTQPDFAGRTQWKFPFLYSATISPANDPFIQSTPGSWEVRVWTDTIGQPPNDSTRWTSPLAAVSVTVASGGRKTVLILDKEGGGLTLRVID